MSIKSKFNKAKEFVKEHDEEIIGFAALAVTTVSGVALGYNIHKFKIRNHVRITDPDTVGLLCNAKARYKSMDVFGGSSTDGFKPSELGKLGEKMIELGINESFPYTHFLAIGDGELRMKMIEET